ncbi:hypothetical protein HKD37_01G001316 [Glycine soja]
MKERIESLFSIEFLRWIIRIRLRLKCSSPYGGSIASNDDSYELVSLSENLLLALSATFRVERKSLSAKQDVKNCYFLNHNGQNRKALVVNLQYKFEDDPMVNEYGIMVLPEQVDKSGALAPTYPPSKKKSDLREELTTQLAQASSARPGEPGCFLQKQPPSGGRIWKAQVGLENLPCVSTWIHHDVQFARDFPLLSLVFYVGNSDSVLWSDLFFDVNQDFLIFLAAHRKGLIISRNSSKVFGNIFEMDTKKEDPSLTPSLVDISDSQL